MSTTERVDSVELVEPVELTKLVYLVWAPPEQTPGETRRRLLDECAPRLLAAGAVRLQMNIADPLAEVRSPAPGVPFERPIDAQVNVWVAAQHDRIALEDDLRREGFELAGYRVDEQIYTDYGGNRHARARDWPDGERSPGVLLVTLMERPKRLARDEWIRRWHGVQSPMSEAMQPRTRYVRNVVQQCLTAGATPFEGIVEEAFPSFRHVTNPFLFYGASGPFALVRNMAIMLRSVTSFLTLWKIRTRPTSEYFVRSEPCMRSEPCVRSEPCIRSEPCVRSEPVMKSDFEG